MVHFMYVVVSIILLQHTTIKLNVGFVPRKTQPEKLSYRNPEQKKPGTHEPGVINISKRNNIMDYNQPDSDNQAHQ